jgi:hypothetical protein
VKRFLVVLFVVAVAALAPAGNGAAAAPDKLPVFWDFVDTGLCGYPIRSVGSGTLNAQFVLPGPRFPLGLINGPISVTTTNLLTGASLTLQAPSLTKLDLGPNTMTLAGDTWGVGAGLPYGVFRGQMTVDLDTGRILKESGTAAGYDLCQALSPGGAFFAPVTSAPPWGLPPAPLGGVYANGLIPILGGLAEHLHAHLDVYVNGSPVTVPYGIGIVDPQVGGPEGAFSAVGIYSPLHTHTADGILHVEASLPPFTHTLGQFFDVWQVRLDNGCLGASCSGLRAWVNGVPWSGDARSIPLAGGAEIVVATGPAYPSPVPSSYAFPPDEPPVVIPPPG